MSVHQKSPLIQPQKTLRRTKMIFALGLGMMACQSPKNTDTEINPSDDVQDSDSTVPPDNSDSSDPQDTADTAPPDEPAEPDCPLEGGEAGASISIATVHDSIPRRYQIHLPADYDCTPRPLIIGMHGYYGTGQGFEETTSQMFETIDSRGYIGVFPDGLPMGSSGWQSQVTSFNDIDSHNSDGPDGPTCINNAYDYGVYDNCPAAEGQDACNWGTSCADDEGFIRALINEVKTKWTVDSNRIYLTGFSQGGQTTQSLGSRLSDLIAAASPHHGFAANGYTVAPNTPIGLFQVWGDSDRTVDGHGGPSSDGMIYDGAEETALVWAEGLQCDLTPIPYPTPHDGVRGWACEEYPNCANGKEVVTCIWNGAHRWGKTQDRNFALLSMLDFFEKHSK